MKSLVVILISTLIIGVILGCGNDAETTEVVLDLEIRNETLHGNRLEDGVIKVQQGDTVTINLTSDIPAYFHVHGYDLENKIEPEKWLKFTFVATATGNFPLKMHKYAGDTGSHEEHEENEGTEIILGSLQVLPN